MPAFAGDGRYFVRVTDGRNQSSWKVDSPDGRQLPGAQEYVIYAVLRHSKRLAQNCTSTAASAGSSASEDRDAQRASAYNAQLYFDYVQVESQLRFLSGTCTVPFKKPFVMQRQDRGDFSGTFGDFLQLQQAELAGSDQGLAVPAEQVVHLPCSSMFTLEWVLSLPESLVCRWPLQVWMKIACRLT